MLSHKSWSPSLRDHSHEHHPDARVHSGKSSRPAMWKNRAPMLLALFLPFLAHGQTPAETPPSNKRVLVDKTTQTLTAYEGNKIALQSRVSTGRMGRRTPSGHFTAGEKQRMHYSRLFDNAPMPWSVQISGNYFIHGFASVPDHPASHGCIRMPLDGDNPAKRFFDWVETGTPIEVTGDWAGKPPR
jgi:hypothetical protein